MLGELTLPEIEEVLQNNWLGRIGCMGDGHVYIVPVSYHYELNAVHCYSLEGRKIDMMRQHPEVCFEVEEIKDINHWKTVIGMGTFQEITEEAEVALLRPQYVEYMLRQRAGLTALPPDGGSGTAHPEPKPAAPVFYKINFTSLTGRFEIGY